MAYEELFADLLRAEREEKTNPRYTFVVKARSGAPGRIQIAWVDPQDVSTLPSGQRRKVPILERRYLCTSDSSRRPQIFLQ